MMSSVAQPFDSSCARVSQRAESGSPCPVKFWGRQGPGVAQRRYGSPRCGCRARLTPSSAPLFRKRSLGGAWGWGVLGSLFTRLGVPGEPGTSGLLPTASSSGSSSGPASQLQADPWVPSTAHRASGPGFQPLPQQCLAGRERLCPEGTRVPLLAHQLMPGHPGNRGQGSGPSRSEGKGRGERGGPGSRALSL